VADIRADRVNLVLVAVERERIEAAPVLAPERLVETPLELLRLAFEPSASICRLSRSSPSA